MRKKWLTCNNWAYCPVRAQCQDCTVRDQRPVRIGSGRPLRTQPLLNYWSIIHTVLRLEGKSTHFPSFSTQNGPQFDTTDHSVVPAWLLWLPAVPLSWKLPETSAACAPPEAHPKNYCRFKKDNNGVEFVPSASIFLYFPALLYFQLHFHKSQGQCQLLCPLWRGLRAAQKKKQLVTFNWERGIFFFYNESCPNCPRDILQKFFWVRNEKSTLFRGIGIGLDSKKGDKTGENRVKTKENLRVGFWGGG